MRYQAKVVLASTLFVTGLLAGCTKGEEVAKTGPMSENEIKAEMATAPQLSPGKYEAGMEILRFELPGMPPEQLAQIREQMKSAMAVKRQYCLTPEDAQKGREDMLKRLSQARGDCRFENFNVAGDKVSGRMICGGGNGAPAMTMAMNGTMQPDKSDMTMETHVTNPDSPGQSADMTMRITTRRLGECDGTESRAPAAPGLGGGLGQ